MKSSSKKLAVGVRDLAVDVRDLAVRYARVASPVFDGVSLEIAKGAITALIGSNGSGKSTLLKAIARQLRPERGLVLLAGEDIAQLSQRELGRRLGMLFQENQAPEGLTVEELVRHGRYPHRRLFEPLTEEDERAIERAFALTGCGAWRGKRLERCSGGQRQLAWIAMVLAQETDVLLLDEPTTFLDLRHQIEVMQVVERLSREQGLTIVMVVHDVNQAARHADHLIALVQGEVVAAGSPEATLTVAGLRQIYGIEADVLRASDGGLVCVPIDTSPRE